MANQVVFEIVGQANSYVNSLTKATAAAVGLDGKNELLARQGIRTSEVFREQLVELQYLTREFKNDELAVAALTAKKKQLIGEMDRLVNSSNELSAANLKVNASDRLIDASTGRYISGARAKIGLTNQLNRLGIYTKVQRQEEIRQLDVLLNAYQDDVQVTGQLTARKQQLTQALRSTAVNASGANNVIFGLGYTINDAQQFTYGWDQGLRAIGNNVPILVQNLTYMEGGIKGIGRALKGAGGLVLLLSIAGTAMTVFANATKDANKETDELEGHLDTVIGQMYRIAGSVKVKVFDNLEDAEAERDMLQQQADALKAWADSLIETRTKTVATSMGAVTLEVDESTLSPEMLAQFEEEYSLITKKIQELNTQIAKRRIEEEVAGIEVKEKKEKEAADKKTILIEDELERTKELGDELAQLLGHDRNRITHLRRVNEELEKQVEIQNRIINFRGVKGAGVQGVIGTDEDGLPTIGGEAPDLMGPSVDQAGRAAEIQKAALEEMSFNWKVYLTENEEGFKILHEVASNTFGGFAALAGAAFDATGGKMKIFFKLYKAFAIAQAVADTYASAQAAYKSMAGIPIVGPALGVAAAAGAVAFGLANIAKIAAAEPGGSAGGGTAAATGANPVTSGGVTTRQSRIITAPTPTGIFNSNAAGSSTLHEAASLERAVKSLDNAVRKMPDHLTTRVEGDTLIFVTEKARSKQSAGLGIFE